MLVRRSADARDRRFDHLTEDFAAIRLFQEDQTPKLDKILDVVMLTHERLARRDAVVDMVEDHDHRIAALENLVRKPTQPR